MAVWRWGLANLLVCVLTGCTTQARPAVTTSTGISPPPNAATQSFATPPRPVELALRDLAQQLGVPVTDIEIVTIERAVWPNKCLGVAAPELCAPGSVSGYIVSFRVSGKEYYYHTDAFESFRYAGPGDAPGPT